MNPETVKRIDEQARQYAEDVSEGAVTAFASHKQVVAFEAELRKAYMTGAEAGYVAAKAEGRQP